MNQLSGRALAATLATAAWLLALSPALAAGTDSKLIPYDQFTLENGLRVIVHEDRRTPIVAVSVWYHVGSKDEPPGKTGFAHLFEHLMFRGSENFSGVFFDTLQNVGATSLNGTTSLDRTNYYATVPTPALELVLWLESDRMGHLLGAVTQDALDDERGIVQNEKRQGENRPYGKVASRMQASLFPQGHPYHHSTIGSMEDLNGASLDDVHQWFREYYGAANAVIVLAGDINARTARPLVEKYFGDIPPGPPPHRLKSRVPQRSLNTREVMYDKVAQTAVFRAWVAPGVSTRDRVLLDIAASVLGDGKNSRLHRELVKRRKLATGVRASVSPGELASVLELSVFIKPGVAVTEVERALDEILADLLEKGPERKELRRIQDKLDAFTIWGMENLNTKAQILARGALYAGDPGFIDSDIAWTRQADKAQVRQVARDWLARGYHQLTVMPFGNHRAIASDIDRSIMPAVENKIVLGLPAMQETVLSNGIKVVLAERHEVPVLELAMTFDNAGSNTDTTPDIKRQTAATTFRLMNDGPETLSATEYTDRKERLGLQIRMGAAKENGWSSLSALRKNLADSLSLWSDALRRPAFRETDMTLWRESALQDIRQSRNSPNHVAGRILSSVLYGPGHPYAAKWQREEAVNALALADLRGFHATRVRPDQATLFVVGDIALAELVPQLERVFGDWKAPAAPAVTAAAIEPVAVAETPRVILVDRPNSSQTAIAAGTLIPSSKHPDTLAFAAANDALGGGMTARIGNNLRVRRGWSYGAGSSAQPALEQRLWQVGGSVQVDKTAESVVEIIEEIRALTGDKPITAKELSRFVQSRTLSQPGEFASTAAVLESVVQNAVYGWPYDRAEGLRDRLQALRLEQVNSVAKKYFQPQALTWVLVGDLAKLEHKIRELAIGTVEVWNAEGQKVR